MLPCDCGRTMCQWYASYDDRVGLHARRERHLRRTRGEPTSPHVIHSRIWPNGRARPRPARPCPAFAIETFPISEFTRGPCDSVRSNVVLQLTSQQIQILGAAPHRDFVMTTVATCRLHFGRECAALGQEASIQVVEGALRNARFHGYRSRQDGVYFALLAFMMGSGFASDRLFPWAVGRGSGGASQKLAEREPSMSRVFDQAVDYVAQTAGEELQHLQRAMIRIRNFDLRQIGPGNPADASFVNVALALFTKLYPELWVAVPPHETAALIEESLTEGRRLGIVDAQGSMVYLAMRLLLGHHVARDPLYPWASQVFENTWRRPERRTAELYTAAMRHLESSLQGESA